MSTTKYKLSWNKCKKKSQQRNRSYTKEPNENYRTEKYNNRFKNSLCGVNSRVMTEDRVREIEDK